MTWPRNCATSWTKGRRDVGAALASNLALGQAPARSGSVTSMIGVEAILERAIGAAAVGEQALRDALDQLPAAIYVTDADGVITYFNPACIDFTGRRPEVGQDRWCVTWRLHTNAGEFLPHDECPMAVAINTQRPIRGVTAVAERPDGTRVNFRPYPTPIFD